MDSTNELFATIETAAPVATVRIKGPSVSDREGGIVNSQITTHLEQAASPIDHVVLDFSDVSFLNSAGIGALITMRSDLTSRGTNVIFYALSAEILQVLKITQLDKLFQIATDEKKLGKMTSKKPKR